MIIEFQPSALRTVGEVETAYAFRGLSRLFCASDSGEPLDFKKALQKVSPLVNDNLWLLATDYDPESSNFKVHERKLSWLQYVTSGDLRSRQLYICEFRDTEQAFTFAYDEMHWVQGYSLLIGSPIPEIIPDIAMDALLSFSFRGLIKRMNSGQVKIVVLSLFRGWGVDIYWSHKHHPELTSIARNIAVKSTGEQ